MLFSLPYIPCHAELYKYNELEINSYDQMAVLVRAKIERATEIDLNNQRQAEKSGQTSYNEAESINLLKDALRLILSRPNKDNLVEKLIPEVRQELNNYQAYYDSLHDITVEAVTGLNQKIPVVYRSTYIFVLENIMSELRPQLKTNSEVQKIFQYIRDAQIKIPNDVRLDRKLRSMFKSQSPSETAAKIIETDLPKTNDKKNGQKKGFWQWLFGS